MLLLFSQLRLFVGNLNHILLRTCVLHHLLELHVFEDLLNLMLKRGLDDLILLIEHLSPQVGDELLHQVIGFGASKLLHEGHLPSFLGISLSNLVLHLALQLVKHDLDVVFNELELLLPLDALIESIMVLRRGKHEL